MSAIFPKFCFWTPCLAASTASRVGRWRINSLPAASGRSGGLGGSPAAGGSSQKKSKWFSAPPPRALKGHSHKDGKVYTKSNNLANEVLQPCSSHLSSSSSSAGVRSGSARPHGMLISPDAPPIGPGSAVGRHPRVIAGRIYRGLRLHVRCALQI